jgi:TatD DNase family protein
MLIDAHAHLDKYSEELPKALEEIKEQQIFTIAVAMDVPSYKRSLEITEGCALVLSTFGIHPRRAPKYADHLSELGPLIEQSPAIGEIGLDFHWVENSSEYPAQLKVLEYFLAAAREQKKIVNLHTKGAERKVLDLLERYDIERAIVHWYSGPLDILRAMVQFGAYFTIGVEVFYSDTIRTIAKEIPNHLLLTETDNPGGLKWLKRKVGMPNDIIRVVEAIAELKAAPSDMVEGIVHENMFRLLKEDPWLSDVRSILTERLFCNSKPET